MTAGPLEAVDLTVAAGGSFAVTGWSATFQAGEMVALHGGSGSGKTTLLYALAGLTAPGGGRVLAGGRPAVLWEEESTGIVFQNLCLSPVLTARETVALPAQAQGRPRRDTAEHTGAALEALGLADHSGRLIDQLSGGQRQRVAVARAVAGGHDYVLADEPTSALDAHWRHAVLRLLAGEARRGAVVIVATSDDDVAARCDRRVSLGV